MWKIECKADASFAEWQQAAALSPCGPRRSAPQPGRPGQTVRMVVPAAPRRARRPRRAGPAAYGWLAQHGPAGHRRQQAGRRRHNWELTSVAKGPRPTGYTLRSTRRRRAADHQPLPDDQAAVRPGGGSDTREPGGHRARRAGCQQHHSRNERQGADPVRSRSPRQAQLCERWRRLFESSGWRAVQA